MRFHLLSFRKPAGTGPPGCPHLHRQVPWVGGKLFHSRGGRVSLHRCWEKPLTCHHVHGGTAAECLGGREPQAHRRRTHSCDLGGSQAALTQRAPSHGPGSLGAGRATEPPQPRVGTGRARAHRATSGWPVLFNHLLPSL